MNFLLKIVHSHPGISTLKEARDHISTSSFHWFPKSNILEKRAKEDVTTLRVGSPETALTSSFHCEVCKELLRESGVCPRG